MLYSAGVIVPSAKSEANCSLEVGALGVPVSELTGAGDTLTKGVSPLEAKGAYGEGPLVAALSEAVF